MRKKRSLISEIAYTIKSLCKGLGVTFVHFFRKKVTLQYPEQRWELPEGYRGLPVLPVDQKTGTHKCIACGSCARVCPEQVITIGHEVGEDKKRRLKTFTIDASRCMFCGLCTEACPTNGLVSSKHFELATDTKSTMLYDLERLMELGGVFPEEPETNDDDDSKTEGAA